MRDFFIRMCRLMIKVLYIFPVRRKLITFVAFHGDSYTCSPKYITEYMAAFFPDYCLIWAFNNPSRYEGELPDGVGCVKYKSLKYIYYALVSEVRINNAEEWALLERRKEQLVINTWHGGGVYKRVAHAAGLVDKRLGKTDYYNISNLFLSSCHAASELMYRQSFGYSGEICEDGLPRNDIIINLDDEKRTLLKKKLGMEEGYKVALYAPTFRESAKSNIEPLDISRLVKSLETVFGGNWKVWSRAHLATCAGMGYSDFFESLCTDMSAYSDMQELLCVSDVLITDYSSSIWDFSFTNRPIFLYTPDLAQYRGEERGFYTDISEWGFPYAQDNDEMERNILDFTVDKYMDTVDRHHRKLGSFETGRATEKTVEYILNWNKKRESK